MESICDIKNADSPGCPSFGKLRENSFDPMEEEDFFGGFSVTYEVDNIPDEYDDGGKCIDNIRKVDSASDVIESKSISKPKPKKQSIIKTDGSPGPPSFGDWGEDPFDLQEDEECFGDPSVPAEFNNMPEDYVNV